MILVYDPCVISFYSISLEIQNKWALLIEELIEWTQPQLVILIEYVVRDPLDLS